jgi:hypothetical protein
MSGENKLNKGIKRARTQDQQDTTVAAEHLAGREQLLLTSPELQNRLGRKFVDSAGSWLGSPSAHYSDRGEATRRR